MSTRPPAISWPCPRCRSRVFDCSERFRANSNGKLVDIWLIYRCRQCESTKNVTVVERRPVARVPRDLLRAAEVNDDVVARRLARDVSLLRSNGMAVAEGDEWVVEHQAAGNERVVSRTAQLPLRLVFPEPLLARLDRIVAAALDVPRSRLPVDVDRRLRLISDVPVLGPIATSTTW